MEANIGMRISFLVVQYNRYTVGRVNLELWD